jgi:uncharacterized DUF497 family protein
MIIDYDPKKSSKNSIERNLSFDCLSDFEWETAAYSEDQRKDYSERRIVGVGYIKERLHVVCFTPIKGGVRVISFRKANKREVKRYEETIDE